MKSFKVVCCIVFLFAFGFVVNAKTNCVNAAPGVQRCVSEVDFEKFSVSYSPQKMSQWCWAACISMIFDYNGHPVSQEKIVLAQYGRLVNLPSGDGWTIAKQLNRRWIDDDERKFSSILTAAFDPMANVYAMNNVWIVNLLHSEQPFILGTGGHAVVATRVDYMRDFNGNLQVNSIGVFDPWPGNGARTLGGIDLVPIGNGGKLQFAASALITSH